MDFDDRLKQAIERGQRRGDQKSQAARAQAMSEDELKRLHSQYRLKLSEHIEDCIQRLAGHFPGFQCETIFGDRGWGAACSRDDLRLVAGRREASFSRLEMTVRPPMSMHVLDLAAKGTVRNKEVFIRNYFEKLQDADLTKFLGLVDTWVLEYAELYAAKH